MARYGGSEWKDTRTATEYKHSFFFFILKMSRAFKDATEYGTFFVFTWKTLVETLVDGCCCCLVKTIRGQSKKNTKIFGNRF